MLYLVNIKKYWYLFSSYYKINLLNRTDIMRRNEYSGKNLNKLVKVKRRRINWIQALYDIKDDAMISYCNSLFKKLRHGKSMSLNRCAYNTIRHFYSTTSIVETVRKLGL